MTRKFTFLMTTMALIFAIMGPRTAWGQTKETIVSSLNIANYAATNSWQNETKYTSAIVESVTFTATGGTNTGKYYSSDNTWRYYANENATITFSVPEGNELISIKPTYTIKDNGIVKYNSTNIFSGDIVNVSGSSVTFNISQTSGSKGKVFFTNIEVSYSSGSVATLESISIKTAPTKLTYTEGEYFDPTGLVITKHFVEDDAEDEDVAYSPTTASQFSFDPSLTTALTTDNNKATITVGGKSVDQAITVNEDISTSVTYTIASATSVTTNGTAPEGSSATFNNTYANNKEQLTSGNSMTLTLSGYAGKKITRITLSMHSNSGTGAGTFSATAGSTTLASISNATPFNQWFDNTSFGTSYRDVHVTMSNNNYAIQNGENVVIVIAATTNSLYCQSFTIAYEDIPFAVATPTFNPAAGTYNEAQNVTIACATGGASIYYTLDGSTPTNASTPYTGAIAISETTTVKAIAYSTTDEASNVATAIYTIRHPLTTMDEIFAAATAAGSAETDVIVTFNNWVISGVKNSNAYLTDNAGKGLIIYASSHGFDKGDILSGSAACKVQLYRGAAEFTNLTATTQGISVTEGGTVTPVEMNIADLGGVNTGAVITVNDVEYTGSDIFSDGENTIKAYNAFMTLPSFTSGRQYNLTGVYIQYAETKEIAPRSSDDIYLIPATEYTITFDETQDGGEIFVDLPTTTASAGTEIQISATANDGYKFTKWIINPSVEFINETTSADEIAYFTMPANDVTISAEFELIPTVSYYFIENGIYSDEIEATEGTYITLPVSYDINDFTFAGWTTDPSDVENILAAGSEYTIADDVIFYAVYAKEEGGETTTPDAYTAGEEGSFVIATLVEGIYYAIPTNPTVISGKITGVAIETERANNVTYVSTENANGYTWTITDATYGQTLSDGSKYLYHSNGGASGTNLSYGTSTSYTWNITTETVNNNEVLKFQAMNSSDSDNSRGLLASTNDNETKFGGYSLSNSSTSGYSRIVVLPIATNSSTTHYYTRVFQEGDVVYEIYGPSIIPSGVTLSTSSLRNTNPANLIIEDGAQLIQYNEETPTAATVRKNITGYTSNEGGYNLIATPIVDGSAVSAVQNGTYDLYRFNQAAVKEWENVKAHSTDFTTLNNGTGYLYANSADVTLEFVGDLKQCGFSEPIYPELPEEDYVFRGFNLIGNPFACNATICAYEGGYEAFYILEGDEFTAVDQTYEIKPCEAIFVEACVYEGEDDYVLPIQFITKQQSKGNDSHRNSMNITVSQNESQVIDRAIVSFGGISNLHKFMLNPSHTNISLAKNGETFAAISSETEGEIPVNFKAEKNGTYTITVNTENIDAEYIHLIDNMTGMDTDLLSTPSYTFSAKTSDYASRFKLVFNVKDEASASSANDFAYMSDGNLVISNIEGEATLQIVDMMGRVLSTETVSDSYNKALNLRAGVYVLNLNGMTQKIVVE